MDHDVAPVSLDQFRPSKTLYAVLIFGLLLGTVLLALFKLIPSRNPTMALIIAGVGVLFFTLHFAQLFGGLQKVWREWYKRTWIGNDLVMWSTGPHSLKKKIQSRKLRGCSILDADAPDWVLYLSLGGWRSRPQLFYRTRPTHKLFIRSIDWSEHDVIRLSLRDRTGDCISMHPGTLLLLLEKNEGEPTMGYAVMALVHDALWRGISSEKKLRDQIEKAHAEILACGKDTADLRQDLARCRDTAVLALDAIRGAINRLERCGRIKNIKEYLKDQEREIHATAPQYVIDKILQDYLSAEHS